MICGSFRLLLCISGPGSRLRIVTGTGLWEKWPANRKDATSWAPARCTTICKNCSIKASWRNVHHALLAMILGVAITGCLALAVVYWPRRSRDLKESSGKQDYISISVPRGHYDAHLVSLARLFASTRVSAAIRRRTPMYIL